jgi:hypothetical protein
MHIKSKITFTDANTGKTYPEASPEGLMLERLRELAGLLAISTFGQHGHASRLPQSLENLKPFIVIPAPQNQKNTSKSPKGICERRLPTKIFDSSAK